MIKLKDNERALLKELCSSRKDDTILLWFLEGNPYCTAWVDNSEKPEVAIIIAADFCFLMGKVETPDEISDLLIENARYKVIIAGSLEWVAFMNTYLLDKVYCYKRFAIKHEPGMFDRAKLLQYINNINDTYEIKRIDEEIYHEALIIDWAADGCCFFRSYEEFKESGIGYVAYKDNQMVCIASSYIAYKNRIPVTIGTLEEHRRKGLATACASKLILECLDRNIDPEWDAANMNSVNLAEKLGYHFDKEYDVYSLV